MAVFDAMDKNNEILCYTYERFRLRLHRYDPSLLNVRPGRAPHSGDHGYSPLGLHTYTVTDCP